MQVIQGRAGGTWARKPLTSRLSPGPRVVTSPKSLEIQEKGVSLWVHLVLARKGIIRTRKEEITAVFSYTPQSSTRERRGDASLFFFLMTPILPKWIKGMALSSPRFSKPKFGI